MVTPDVILFFEIVDFLNFSSFDNIRYQKFGPDSGWHHVAWAFIKLVAANGELNTEKRLRLQLYKPKNKFQNSKTPTVPIVSYYF